MVKSHHLLKNPKTDLSLKNDTPITRIFSTISLQLLSYTLELPD